MKDNNGKMTWESMYIKVKSAEEDKQVLFNKVKRVIKRITDTSVRQIANEDGFRMFTIPADTKLRRSETAKEICDDLSKDKDVYEIKVVHYEQYEQDTKNTFIKDSKEIVDAEYLEN